MTPEKYFLFARSDNGQYWPLDFKPTTLSRVRQLQRHMAPAFTPARDYVVATWDATAETFRAPSYAHAVAHVREEFPNATTQRVPAVMSVTSERVR